MPTVVREYEEEDTREYTRALFASLVRQRLVDEGIPEDDVQSNPQLDFLRMPYSETMLQHLGQDLRRISDEFSKSPERVMVRARSQKVSFENMEYEHFRTFLDELFLNGITRERIVILFFFCSDVILRAYDTALPNMKKLFNWFLSYILDKVCSWVESHGGWSKVLNVHLPNISKTVFYVVASAALMVFIVKSIL